MKSDEIGMPLPQNHVKSVEYNNNIMPLELCLHVSLHVVGPPPSTPIMHEIYVRQCLVKSRNSKFLISFGVSVLTVLMWPYHFLNVKILLGQVPQSNRLDN